METFLLSSQVIVTLSTLILFTAFYMLARKRIMGLVVAFSVQGILLASATAIQAYLLHHSDLYFSAGLTLTLKAILVPVLLNYLVKQFPASSENPSAANSFFVLLGAAALVLFSYYLIKPLAMFVDLPSKNILVIATSVMFLGIFLMIVRREAVAHVIGFMEMENGLFFAALVSTEGMPMTVELGIAFDILVAAVLFGVFFFHIRTSIDSLDVDQLNLLREDVE